MNISQKLYLSFALMLVLAIIVGAIGVIGMQSLYVSNLSMYEKQVVGLEYIGKATAALKQVRLDARQVVVSSFYDDRKGALDAKEQFEASKEEFEHWMREINRIAATDELRRFHDRIMELFTDSYIPDVIQIIDTSINDMPAHAYKLRINVMLVSLNGRLAQMENLILGMMDLNSALAYQTSHNNAELTQVFLRTQLFLLAVAVLGAVSMAYYIIRSIAVPINEASGALREIAKGNFAARVTGDYKGDLELIKNSVNDTAEKLSQYLSNKLEAERSAHESEIAKERANAAKEAIVSSIDYASKIQRNLLPKNSVFEKAFSDYSVLWSPRDIVGGDIYWLKNYNEGTIICICDCTGHGTPGALLTMLVASALEASVGENSYKDTAEIIWKLDRNLTEILQVDTSQRAAGRSRMSDINDGCDIAVLYVAKDGSVTISAGNLHVFICDGKEVTQIKGQKLHVGEGRLGGKDEVKVVTIPANPNNKFYIASDGLYDQIGGVSQRPFGYATFKKVILQNHDEMQAVISERIWEAFEGYRGDQARRDDVELITFKP